MAEDQIRRSILVIDDEEPVRSAICEFLNASGYDVVDSHSGPDAICKVIQEHFDAIMSDIRMPEMSGLDLIHVFDKICEDTIVILLTAVPDPDANLATLAKEAGVFAYLNKPCKLQLVKDTLDQAFAEQMMVTEESTQVEEQTHDGTESITSESLDQSEQTESAESNSELGPNTQPDRASHISIAIDAIVSDPNQTPLQDKDDIKLSLKTFSHHYGDLKLNAKTAMKSEIEDVILKPKKDIQYLSPDEYIELLREEFVQRGWENGHSVQNSDEKVLPAFDFTKEGIGLKIGLRSTTLRNDFILFQKAHASEEVRIELAVLIIQTGNSQKYLKRKSGQSWIGASFSESVRTLKSIQRQISVPICILGIDVSGTVDGYSSELASCTVNSAREFEEADEKGVNHLKFNLGEMSTVEIKECIFDYLEKKYDGPIERNVRVKGKNGIMGVDGLMRLGADVLMEIEISKSQGGAHARSLSGISEDISKPLRNYQNLTGRKAVMRFVLLGEFTPDFLQDIDWRIMNACNTDASVIIDYEMLSFEDVGIRVFD
ncbi:MAG: response regulator [Chloroflexi bacterium]|jgi:CheY-like chemotaxis protein|nr:response regulator [Chloroflexota bacterium]